MVRLLIFLLLLCAAALGLTWLADHPGQVELTWAGYRIEASAMVALGFVVVLALLHRRVRLGDHPFLSFAFLPW